MTTVELVRRGEFYDVFFCEGKERNHVGSGSWVFIETAKIFYQLERLEVKVYD